MPFGDSSTVLGGEVQRATFISLKRGLYSLP